MIQSVKLIPRLLVCCLTFSIGVAVKRLLILPDYPPISKLNYIQPALPSPSQVEPVQQPIDPEILDTFFKGDELLYHGYQIRRRFKTVIIDDDPTRPLRVEISYAQLTRNNKVLATFDDGVYQPTGNITEFGLFQLLNNGSKQLVVQQLAWRSGRQWVVQLLPTFKILYDSATWHTSQEYIRVVDLNGDRNYEIIQQSNCFFSFVDTLAPVSIPRPRVVFRYDAKSKEFLPANLVFADYLLRDVIKEHRTLIEKPQPLMLHEVLPVAIDYMYAGRRREGWALFERLYRFDDKAKTKNRLKAILRVEPVYNYIH